MSPQKLYWPSRDFKQGKQVLHFLEKGLENVLNFLGYEE